MHVHEPFPSPARFLLRGKREHGSPTPPAPDSRVEARDNEGGTILVCRACRHRITRESARIPIQGRHSHVFYNPQGMVFELGCFAMAPGCLGLGPSTTEFTWFPGYAWQPVFCGSCREHLGWRYLSESGSGFFGLILDRLAEEPEET